MTEFTGTERFEIIRRIGHGGMGVVYEALDRERRMHVALKRLSETDDSALYLFKQEFRSLTDVVHPNLVTLYELFASENAWFFTMELIHGPSFLDFIRHEGGDEAVPITGDAWLSHAEPPPPWALSTVPMSALDRPSELLGHDIAPPLPLARMPRLREAFRQLVTGAAALHESGKLHCDIKPSNALVAEGNRVVLLDFGLVAPRRQGTIEHRASLDARGTILYMAPEQARGEELTPAADWYAVGVTLYQALTGRLPFATEGSNALERKLTADPPPPSALAPAVPEDLERLCMRLLRRDPSERPATGDILAALGGKGYAANGVSARPALPRQTALVGREPQLRLLTDAFAEVRAGHTIAVLAHGPSGVGKTTLLRHFVDDLAAHGCIRKQL